MGASLVDPTSGPLSREEVEDFNELRTLLRPTETLTLLDDFARWLFASAALVGTLGAAFGVTGLNDLSGWGKRLFAFAVLSTAGSLALAALAQMPRARHVHRSSTDSMRTALDGIVRSRCRLLVGAGFLFALALVLAGIAPLVSS